MVQFKLVLLGDSSVGKSSIVHRFVKDSFDTARESTIGAAFLSQTVQLDENTSVKFEIWDTAGQERYKSLAPMYYRNANAAIVVYDITVPDSLVKAQNWVDELKNKVGDNNLVICLVGNKLDLCEGENDDNKRSVSAETATTYAEEQGLCFYEVSAKTGENVNNVFKDIAAKLYEIKMSSQAAASNDNTQPNVDINLQRPSTNDPTSCCS